MQGTVGMPWVSIGEILTKGGDTIFIFEEKPEDATFALQSRSKMQTQLVTGKFKTLFIQNVLEMIPTQVVMVVVGGGGEQSELGWSEVVFHKSRTVEKPKDSSQLE